MTTRYTQDEWQCMIDETEQHLPNAFPQYKAPTLGSPDFAKCIDHTLLRLDATKEQIDELCEEARRYDFQVQFTSPAHVMSCVSSSVSTSEASIWDEDFYDNTCKARW